VLSRARIRFHVDVNVGDPIRPAPRWIDLPRLGGGTIELLAYPLPMVLAEKIVTAVQRGQANTRWRDFADLYLLTRRHELDGAEVADAITTVATHRRADLVFLSEVLDGFADLAQTRWAAWRRKQHLQDRLPEDFHTVLDHVVAVADPCLIGEARTRSWIPGPTTGAWKT
jgi:hypothetical protein